MAERGELSREEIKVWTFQEYFVSLAFPRMMAAVVTRIPDEHEAAKYPLIKNTYEELGADMGLEKSHPNLLRKLIKALGGTQEELTSNRQNSGTRDYLDRLFRICREGTFLEGLGAIGHGNEFLVIYEYGKFVGGMRKSGLLTPENLEFFDVNIQADVDHTRQIEKAMESFIESEENRRMIVRSAREALDARMPFYDDICSQLGL
ncbi:iron-containing redox enzyme family protein [Candidatus Woesearchaeota archaeon]|nr:iron-containing redox enzyme family protein [Candidatus Woesearchaeota archaeon]